MRKILLFGEDFAHRKVVGTLVERIARDNAIDAKLEWKCATGGHGRVVQEFRHYLRSVHLGAEFHSDLLIVATDANCKGVQKREKEFQSLKLLGPTVFAIPDPHIERWLLLDGAAFKAVLGKGCVAPDRKCKRDRYKDLLISEISSAGVRSRLGGIEFAEEIVCRIDLVRAMRLDRSFRRFVANLTAEFRRWK